jgi:hypothetical protein
MTTDTTRELRLSVDPQPAAQLPGLFWAEEKARSSEVQWEQAVAL